MTMLVLGLVVFLGAHVFTLLREPRAAAIERLGMGGYKRLYSIVSLIGLVLIVYGFSTYRAGGYIAVFTPPNAMRHLAMLLMLPVFVLFAAVYLPGLIKAKAKLPLLLAVKFWALAHLIANGDLGSLLLFGALLAWAVAARIAAKRRGEAGDVATATGWTQNDSIATVIGLVVYAVFAFWLHPILIGVPVLSR